MVNLKSIRERVAGFFNKSASVIPPPITDLSALHDIALQHPHAYEFIERKYGVKITPDDRQIALKKFVEKYGLPPAQILFMEVQMSTRTKGVQQVPARKAKQMVDNHTGIKILDVRETWELQMGRIPTAKHMSPAILDEILNSWAKDTPILLYCHFGVRSLDAASFLVDRGFTEVFALTGGIDAWSQEVDPSLRRYEGNWC